MADINAPLTSDEFQSLYQVSIPMGRIIPDLHQKRLRDLGFIEQKLRGWVLTPLGQARMTLGR